MSLFFVATFFLAACATGPQVTRTQDLAESADTPYEKLLVITLFSSFDSRHYLEQELVTKLSELGTDAVASTSMMDSTTPVTRQTFMAMVDKIGADAVLVTQLASLQSKGTVKDMRPQTTVNFRTTGYFNVFSVEVTEYLEPQSIAFEHSLVLVTELFSVLKRDAVWAIESRSRISLDHETVRDYSIYVDEADAIATYLSRDGLIAKRP